MSCAAGPCSHPLGPKACLVCRWLSVATSPPPLFAAVRIGRRETNTPPPNLLKNVDFCCLPTAGRT